MGTNVGVVGGEPFRWRPLLVPFYLPGFVGSVGAAMIAPVLPLYAQYLGGTLAAAGLAVAAVGFGNLIFNLPAGFLVGRFGEKRMMVAASLVEIAVAVAAAVAGGPALLLVAMAVYGMAGSLYSIARLAYFRRAVTGTYRGRALAMVGGVYRFGSFVGPIIGGLVAAAWGFRAAFWGFSISRLFVTAVTAVAVRDLGAVGYSAVGAAAPPAGERGPGPLARTFAILKAHRRTFLTAGTAIILLQFLRAGRQAILPLWGDAIGLTVTEIGTIMGLMFFVELFMVYPAGFIMDRFGRKNAAVPCLLLLGISLGLLPLAGSFAALLALSAVGGIGNGLGSGINMTLSTDFAPNERPGEFIGVWRLVVDSGTAAGPAMVGAMAGIFSIGAAGAVMIIPAIAGALIMGLLVPGGRSDPG